MSGDRQHLVVEAVAGTPDVLVSGTTTAVHCVLGRRGRLVAGAGRRQRTLLPARRRRRLAALARRAASVFDGPQDLEWAVDAADRLWLLQSRPVTACGEAASTAGPILRPGPVAETFPDPLRPLEVALWVEPLRAGVVGALGVTGAVGRKRLDRSPVVTTIGGRVAADLELFGIAPRRRSPWRALNPLPAARHLFAAWRVGRLRAALPALAADLVAKVDADLAAVGDLAALEDERLVDLLVRAREELVALHAHEVLAGMLMRHEDDRSSLASIAVATLAEGRANGLPDDELVSRIPVVLALLPPAVGRVGGLPPTPPSPQSHSAGRGDLAGLGPREALRLRCRWVQELGARAAAQLGARLAAAGLLERIDLVAELTVDELRAAIDEGRVPTDLTTRASTPAGPPLPVTFRLTPSGAALAVRRSGHPHADGLAASGGRAAGVACHGPAELTKDEPCVLVVDTLDPRLAPALPELAGLVSETGSALSHLAILAREMHVPTVVAVPDARARFPSGTALLVDGNTGEVRAVAAKEDR